MALESVLSGFSVPCWARVSFLRSGHDGKSWHFSFPGAPRVIAIVFRDPASRMARRKLCTACHPSAMLYIFCETKGYTSQRLPYVHNQVSIATPKFFLFAFVALDIFICSQFLLTNQTILCCYSDSCLRCPLAIHRHLLFLYNEVINP